jgi:nucleotide-binding universal stress UspA family protein
MNVRRFSRRSRSPASVEVVIMFKRLLLATDGSELAGKAVATGLRLAKSLGADVVAVVASEPWTAMTDGMGFGLDFPVDQYEQARAARAEQILRKVREDAAREGVKCATVHVKDFPAEGIMATAKAEKCDLIVMASHGRRGISRLLLGSQAARVVTSSTVPVLVCR